MEPESMEVIEVLDASTALTAQEGAQIDKQIATAKQYPRGIREFLDTTEELMCLDEETAASCFYSLPPRSGSSKPIEGPSVRAAEIIAYAYKNLRCESNIEAVDQKFITTQGTAFDLERNVAVRTRVKRRITTKEGKRFSDDMIAVTANAAGSIAFREAIFRLVPRALWKQVIERAKKTAVGDAKLLATRRNAALDWFTSVGVSTDKVLAKLGRGSIEQITRDDLIHLTGLKTALKDGEITVEAAFADAEKPKEPGPTKGKQSVVGQRIKAAKKEAEAPKEPEQTQIPTSPPAAGYILQGGQHAGKAVTELSPELATAVLREDPGLTGDDMRQLAAVASKRQRTE